MRRRRALPAAGAGVLSYALAMLIGVWAALQAFPFAGLLGAVPRGMSPDNDYLQHVTGELYFMAQPWHWPLFNARNLDAPHGVNIALTDSIPLVAFVLKVLHPLLPSIRQGIDPWLGVAWVMQPVAAVFALRGTGERSAVACIAVALMAASMPTFLLRVHHAALDGHFLLLGALGLYLRATSPASSLRPMAMLAALVVPVLFIHPYLMAMVACIAASVPLTLAGRVLLGGGARVPHAWTRPLQSAAIALAGCAATAGAAWLFGYMGGRISSEYGLFSMNLAAPFWPVLSRFAPWLTFESVDATGGQFEGFQYLGAGLLALLASVLLQPRGRSWLRACLRRHAGLLLVLAGLSAFAVSTHVYLLHLRVMVWDVVPPLGTMFRASGRFFWPASYVLLLASVRGASVTLDARAAVLLATAALQVLDAWTLRTGVREREALAWRPLDAMHARLDGVVGHYRSIVIQPRLECDDSAKSTAMQVVFLAARHGLPVNTMYVSRAEPANACDRNADTSRELVPGELGVAYGLGRARQAAAWRRDGASCEDVGDDTLCTPSGAGFASADRPQSRGAAVDDAASP